MKDKSKCVDLTGKRFERLLVVDIDYERKTRKTYWICKCDCGNTKSVRSDSLQCGAIASCGCLKKEQDEGNLDRTSHGLSKTRLYTEWQAMKGRCYNKKNECYAEWGGRGIRVCEEWKDDYNAFHSWALNNGYAENLTLDRKDNNGDYSPHNCRWATNKEQSNNRSSNVLVEHNGEQCTIMQLAEMTGLDYGMLLKRHNNGYVGDDLIKPSGEYFGQNRGEIHHNVKLTEEIARKIKIDIAAGMKNVDIAYKNGVTPGNVGDIKRKKTWAWVEI